MTGAPVELRALLVEDSPDDALQILRVLKGGGYAVRHERVDSRAGLAEALERARWDIVIADFRMPGFGGRAALTLTREHDPDLPFIVVSGTIGEDTAAAMIRAGASDYVMKTDLARLVPAVTRELREATVRVERAAAREARRESELRLRQMAEAIRDIFFIQDLASSRLIYVSPAYEEISGRTCQSLHTDPGSWAGCLHPDDRDRVMASFTDATAAGFDHEFRMFRADGEPRWLRARSFPILDGAGLPYRRAGVVSDITAARQAQARIKRLNRVHAVLSGINSLIVRVQDKEALFREACQIAVEHGAFEMAWIGVVDPQTQDGAVVAWAGGYEGYVDKIVLTTREGAPQSELPACRALRLKRPVVCDDIAAEPAFAALRDELARRGHKSVACFPLSSAGSPHAVLTLVGGEAGIFDAEEVRLLLELAGDISFALDHLEKAQKIDHLAYYDPITGLANRTLFLERVEQRLIGARSAGRRLSVIALDVDRFSTLNDALGRAAGDELLRQIAERLRATGGGDERFARIDRDHFAIVVAEAQSGQEIARLIEARMAACFGPPFLLAGGETRVSAKLGVAVFPGDGADADALLANARAALRRAKASSDAYLFYAQEMSLRVAEKLALENRLRGALERNEFVLHYQPKVDARKGRIVGVEALMRWQSPQRGLVPPLEFISTLEETGLILAVGAWALRQAADDRRRWQALGLDAPRVAVNVSQVQLRERDFVSVVQDAIGAGDTRAGIDLEITESLMMEDVEANIAKLKTLNKLGVGIAIDDFGTGYSSLGYLARLPAQSLKIDRSFVSTMHNDPNSMTLVSTILSLAHSMRLKVVAEGVETEEQAKLLRLLGCDELQGHLLGRPMPFEGLTALLVKAAAQATPALGEFPPPSSESPDTLPEARRPH